MGNDATTDTLQQAGKVIAVHINYPSRAAERGRTPEQPSYFLKPSTSLALTGGSVERPAGCELLGFEGEIALVIGKTARRVSIEDAWSYVGGVTASNDLGVYDLRWADKGSNLRSKGGDGFTPVGPAILNAADVDPANLRVRTWVNGELAQDDTTADLLFPFAQLVADLSQLLTLEPGDLILTGTPAGASVAVPGDRLEVEVDVPGTDKTTGRLATTVTEGTTPLAAFGAQPKIDDKQREEAWGSAEKAGLALKEPAKTLTPELKAKLESVATATLSSQMRARGLNNVSIDGLTSTRPAAKVVGTARTLRFVPAREDLFASHGGGYNVQKRLFDAVGDGEVIVIEARGDATTGTLGDILALRAKTRGASGVVTDGGVRDFDEVARIGLPVFSQGAHPSVLGRKHVPWELDVTIGCGGAAVQPGDIIVGDGDGVIVIPPSIVDEVVDAALAQEDEDAWIAEQVEAGHPVDGLFPMNAEWRAKYEAARTRESGRA